MLSYKPQDSQKVADRIFKTGIAGLFYLAHQISPDERGYFSELSLIPDLEKVTGATFTIKQLNLAHSFDHVIRGFHAEGWNKLIALIKGTAFSALVDIRPDSATFGRVETFLLGDQPEALKGSLYIPQGVANSVCVVSGPVDYLYCVDRLYRDRNPQGDRAINLFDPDIKVDWPIPQAEMIISPRDRQAVTLKQLFPQKFT